MIDQQAAFTAYAVRNSRRQNWPYPHILPQQVLSPDLFDALRRMRVEDGILEEHPYAGAETRAEAQRFSVSYEGKDLDEGRVNTPELATAYRVLSHALVKRALIAGFAPELTRNFGALPSSMGTSFTYVEDRTGYRLLPHTDAARKAVTLLIYLAEEDDNPDLGTEIYIPREAAYPDRGPNAARHRRENFLCVTRVPFRPNQGLAFPPAGNTYHGVGEVSEGRTLRRLVQFQLIAQQDRAPAAGQE